MRYKQEMMLSGDFNCKVHWNENVYITNSNVETFTFDEYEII